MLWVYDDGRARGHVRYFVNVPQSSRVVVESAASPERPRVVNRPRPSKPREPPEPAQRERDRALFGLPRVFTLPELSRQLRRRARHPDQGGDGRAMRIFTEAYTRLRNETYDPE
jgi:hypothetical protein